MFWACVTAWALDYVLAGLLVAMLSGVVYHSFFGDDRIPASILGQIVATWPAVAALGLPILLFYLVGRLAQALIGGEDL